MSQHEAEHEFKLPVVIEIEIPKIPTERDDFIEALGQIVLEASDD